MRTEAEILDELKKETAKLDAAYWTFTRTARGSPVPMCQPAQRIYELEQELKELRRTQRHD